MTGGSRRVEQRSVNIWVEKPATFAPVLPIKPSDAPLDIVLQVVICLHSKLPRQKRKSRFFAIGSTLVLPNHSLATWLQIEILCNSSLHSRRRAMTRWRGSTLDYYCKLVEKCDYVADARRCNCTFAKSICVCSLLTKQSLSLYVCDNNQFQ